MVIIHICHFYHCPCVTAGGQIVPEGTCRAVFCFNGLILIVLNGMGPFKDTEQDGAECGTFYLH